MAKAKVGRPTLFKQEFIGQAAKLVMLGATDKALCDFFGVCEATLNLWKLKHPDFSESIKETREFADNQVERSLYKRAMGFSYIETTQELSAQIGDDGKPTTGLTVTKKVEKVAAPDTVACIFWLKNRQPKSWRDKQELEHSGGVTIVASPLDERL